MTEGKLPEGWKEVSIGSVLKHLPKKDQRLVVDILKSGRRSMTEKTKLLRELFSQHEARLKKAGFDTDFLAYAFVYAIQEKIEGKHSNN